MKKLLAMILTLTLMLTAVGALAEQQPASIRFYNYALSETAKAAWWQETIDSFKTVNPGMDIECITVDYNSMIATFTNDLNGRTHLNELEKVYQDAYNRYIGK